MSGITPYLFQKASLRVIDDGAGSFEVVAKDVAEALGYTWQSNVIAHVPEEWKGVKPINTPGGPQQMVTLLESGLYFFLGRSDKPDALPMQKWVSGEVLPSIRKTGGYSMAPRETGPLLPATYADALRALADKVEETQRIETERDQAIATKAEIGSRREATAMATASAKSREVARLQHELGRNAHHATMIAVEKASGRKFGDHDWRPLKKYCKEHDLHPEAVPDKRYGESKAWPAAAWHAVYGIDLGELFPSAVLEAA